MDISIWLTAGGVLLLLVFSAFFSGAETALTAVSRPRMMQLEKAGEKSAARVLGLTEDRERLIGCILLGNNLVNIFASALATSLFLRLLGDAGVLTATAVMTVLVVIFAEVLPKTVAIAQPARIARAVSLPISTVVRLFTPAVKFVEIIVEATLRLCKIKAEEESVPAHEELRGAIDYHHSEGSVVKDERDRLGGLLDLADLEVDEVMSHRKNMMIVNADQPVDQIVRKIVHSPYTRIPLWRDDPENIVGVLNAKDLLRALQDNDMSVEGLDIVKIALPPVFVPETTQLTEQLDRFLASKSHFALVVDEYGALRGLVTLEDILEEIVGEIEDEHDVEMTGINRQPDGSVIVDGGVSVRDFNRWFDTDFPDEEATTVAGLVIHEARTIPEKGQVFTFYGYRFEILDRRRNQITSIRTRSIRKRSG